MITYPELEKEAIKDFLNANWMTHDATWFAQVLQEIGIEKTNRLNRNAVREMAKLEARRLKKILGVRKISDFGELKNFINAGFALIKGPFMNFHIEFTDKSMIWKIPKCFAYEGVKRQGVGDLYECGIVERVFGWFEVLEIKYTISPKPEGCNMKNFGKCEMEIEFIFE